MIPIMIRGLIVWLLLHAGVFAAPRISEFMAINDSAITDEDGETADWIEIHNPDELNPQPMLGYHLTDKAGNLTKWTFPAVTIPANSYLVVFASNKDRRDPGSELHTNFKLGGDGEYLALVAPDGTQVVSEFAPSYPPQFGDVSFGFADPGAPVQVDITPVWNFPDNYSNVKLTGMQSASEDGGTDNLDLGTGDPFTQQYMWFDFSSALAGLPEGATVQSAMLAWSGVVNSQVIGQTAVPSEIGVFAVPDSSHGIDTISDPFSSRCLVDFYAANSSYSSFSAVPGQAPTAFWAIGSLVQQWIDQPGMAERGQVLLINQSQPMYMDWDADGNNRPELTATVFLEPGNAANQWVYFDAATPGGENSSGENAGPVFGAVVENPAQPVSGDLTITAEVNGTTAPVGSVTLFYRLGFGGEMSLVMNPAGGNVYTGVIPASSIVPGEMTRWRFEAVDTSGGLTREPAFRDPLDAHQYFGTVGHDPDIESNLEVLHWFTDNPTAAEQVSGGRGAVYYRGEFYDNVFFNRHGQSSGGFIKKSFNIDFNRTQRFKWHPDEIRLKDINLLTNWADKSKVRHVLAYEIMREAGVHAHFAFTVRVEQNGDFYSTADFVEDGDDRYLERVGLNPEGALYKVYNNRLNADRVINGNSDPDTGTRGVEKKTRREEGNADLQGLIDGLDLTGVDLTNYLFDNIDIPKIVNLLAANSVIRNIDMHSKNWYIYRDTGKTGEWAMLPWDLDLSAGRLWTQTNRYFDNQLYTHSYVRTGTAIRLVSMLFNRADTRSMIMRRIRELSDQYLQPEETPYADRYYERRLDELSALIDPPTWVPSDAQRDFERWGSWIEGSGNSVSYTSTHPDVESMAEAIVRWKTTYLPERRDAIYNDETVGNGGEIPEPQSVLGTSIIDFGHIEFAPASGNQDEEFVTLLNTNAFAVDLSNWQLKGGVEMTFQPGTVIPSGGTLYASPSVTNFRARVESPSGGEGRFVQGNYQGHLSSFGEELVLLTADSQTNNVTTYAGDPSDVQRYLVVSELMYHPSGDGLAEYVELLNISEFVTLDLNGVRFDAGILFDFTGSSVTNLAPGERVLIVRDVVAFELAYGTQRPVAGVFEQGTVFNNQGEFSKLEDALNGTVKEFEYDNSLPWPEAADGLGYSLVLMNPALNPDPDDPASWRSSAMPGGTPGWSDAVLAPIDPAGDVDGNGIADLLDYVFGNNLAADPVKPAFVMAEGLTLRHAIQIAADAAEIRYEASDDLVTWVDITEQIVERRQDNLGDGRAIVDVRFAATTQDGVREYMRVRVQER